MMQIHFFLVDLSVYSEKLKIDDVAELEPLLGGFLS